MEYNWKMASLTENELKIQVTFSEPLAVSESRKNPDTARFTV